MMTLDEQGDAGLALLSAVQHLIEVSGLSYPQAAGCLLVLICEMIATAPDYHDGLPGEFVQQSLPHAIKTGKARQARAHPSTGTMQ